MADVDWNSFADDVKSGLTGQGLSYDGAVSRWPTLNKGLLSRACNGKPLSAGNFLHLCDLLDLDPHCYLAVRKHSRVTMKSILEQAVTAVVRRETQGAGNEL